LIARRLVLSSILVMLAILIICLASGSVRAWGEISVSTDQSSYQLHKPVTFSGHVTPGVSGGVNIDIYNPDHDPEDKENYGINVDWSLAPHQ